MGGNFGGGGGNYGGGGQGNNKSSLNSDQIHGSLRNWLFYPYKIFI